MHTKDCGCDQCRKLFVSALSHMKGSVKLK